jgi:hypothetical protein
MRATDQMDPRFREDDAKHQPQAHTRQAWQSGGGARMGQSKSRPAQSQLSVRFAILARTLCHERVIRKLSSI